MIKENKFENAISFVFIFNLIVGTGALTLPSAFAEAGWIISSILLIFVCIISYITLSFVIESLSIANCLYKLNLYEIKNQKNIDTDFRSESISDFDQLDNVSNLSIENTPLINSNLLSNDLENFENLSNDNTNSKDLFKIDLNLELGQMAKIFFTSNQLKFFYFTMIIYLYGDLTIYVSAISKSLRDFTCTYDDCNKTSLQPDDICWENNKYFDRGLTYKIYILITVLVIGPFVFFNLQKTNYLQILTSILRWIALITMIVLALIKKIGNESNVHPVKINFVSIPNLFGVGVYSFMCHHSLPSLIAPIKNKKNIHRLIFLDYLSVLLLYLILSLTGVFTFNVVKDVYTLNFLKRRCSNDDNDSIILQIKIVKWFLPLFPVFTLGTNFQIIALTLANNLKTLFQLNTSLINFSEKKLLFIFKYFLPILSIFPPILIALFTEDVKYIVGFVGNYAGVSIQYIIPVLLVYKARTKLNIVQINQLQRFGCSHYQENQCLFQLQTNSNWEYMQSKFKGRKWLILIVIWTIFSIFFVTTNYLMIWFD